MKKGIFLIIALIVVLAACGNSNDKKESSKKDDKTIVVGTEGTYSPFSFHDKNDKLTGYDVEVTKAVAKEMGYKVEFKETQ